MAEPENTQDTQAKSGFLGKMIVLGGVAIVSAAIGFSTPHLFLAGGRSASASAEQAPAKLAYIQFGETVVNLDEGRLNRYLRMSITLQVAEEDLAKLTELVEKRRAILKSWLLSYLSDRSMEEIRGAAGQNRLRREILENFNAVLSDDSSDVIHDVLFEEFNIQ